MLTLKLFLLTIAQRWLHSHSSHGNLLIRKEDDEHKKSKEITLTGVGITWTGAIIDGGVGLAEIMEELKR